MSSTHCRPGQASDQRALSRDPTTGSGLAKVGAPANYNNCALGPLRSQDDSDFVLRRYFSYSAPRHDACLARGPCIAACACAIALGAATPYLGAEIQ